MSIKSGNHNKSVRSEKVTAGVSFHDLNNTGAKSNRTSDSAFITSVPGLTYYNKFNFKSNPYDTNQPINEEDERREEVAGDIVNTYNKLQEIIDKLEDRISGVIEFNEQDFWIAFKQRMRDIKKTVKELKEKASDKWINAKKEAKMRFLQDERDFFKNEAFRLDTVCKEFQK